MVRLPTELPAERSPWAKRRLVGAFALAVGLPVLTAAVLIPAREHLNQSAALVLLLPVLAIASIGGAAPSVVAAITASVAFNILLTRPYYSVDIHDDDDVIASVVLLIVAGSVGLIATQLATMRARAAIRGSMLLTLTAFAQVVAMSTSVEAIIDRAGERVMELLKARGIAWTTEPQSTDAPILTNTGHILGRLRDLPVDRAVLPMGLLLPVFHHDHRVGCFVLDPSPHHVVSLEERRTAIAITAMLGAAMSSHNAIDGPNGKERA